MPDSIVIIGSTFEDEIREIDLIPEVYPSSPIVNFIRRMINPLHTDIPPPSQKCFCY